MSVDEPADEGSFQPTLIASDMDGTLLDGTSRFARRTVAAIERAVEQGVEFVVATGRSHWSVQSLLVDAGLDDGRTIRWAICSNGATLFDVAERRVARQHVLDGHELAAVQTAILQAHGEVGLAWETVDGVVHGPTWEVMRKRSNPAFVVADRPVQELDPRTTAVVKLMVAHPELVEVDWLDTISPLVPDGFSVSTSGATFVELTHAEAEKGRALSTLCSELGIGAAETAAFGDHANDLGMLEWAGRGYVMANGHPRALATSHHRAGHHDEDGVAVQLELWFS